MATLVGCGGGGGSAGDCTFQCDGGGNTGLVDLAIAGNSTLSNSGTETLTLTVTALKSGNTALIGVATPINFAVDAGAVITPAGTATNTADGKLSAVVSLVNKANRAVTVTVNSGTITKTFTFNVVDSVSGGKVADVSLVASKTTLPNNGSETITLTATTLDASRVAAGGAPLIFSVEDPSSSALVTPAGGATTTNATTGQLVATLSLGNSPANRTIKVSATSGTVTRSISVDVVDSTATSPVATDLSIALNKATIGNSGSESVEVVVTAVDRNRNAVAGIDVSFTVDSNAVLVVGNAKTAADGTAKANVTIGADRSNRVVTVTARSASFVRQASFRVTGAKLVATLQPATLKVGETGQVQYALTDVNGNAMVGVAITVAGPGTSAAATCPGAAAGAPRVTDGGGRYLYCYVAAGSGPTLVTAEAGGASLTSTVQIDAKLSDVPASTNIASATFTVAPSVVSVNAVGSKDNRADLRLLFLTDKSQPIPNVRVRLGLGENSAGTDGDISSGKDAVVTSDANGVAVSSFVPGVRPSATDQVKVYACFAKDDSVPTIAACPASQKREVALTVVEQPVSISIGTANEIGNGANGQTYTQLFTVLVVDTAGNPKSDVQLTPLLDLPSYQKGVWIFDSVLRQWGQIIRAVCLNEDSSVDGFRNGTIETFGGVSEDLNGNGQLDPRKSDVSITLVGSTKTDANGTALLRIEYPKNYGSWVEYSIRVSASGVVSPPATFGRIANPGDTLLTLKGNRQVTGVPVDAVKAEGEPPFVKSPYGIDNSCSSPN
ncbi:hypothetical protein [Roseateles asaccharophilus]|uniref:hypothetical protein n=1 Tax=Roseateles asaccharophilus TaxID=582607 RepID=UPI003850E008